jgi:hypothetical protein
MKPIRHMIAIVLTFWVYVSYRLGAASVISLVLVMLLADTEGYALLDLIHCETYHAGTAMIFMALVGLDLHHRLKRMQEP